MKKNILILSLLFISNAFAHGENIYGPHKGFIRMPGTFHTELVPNNDGSFYVYLMDLQNKNAATKNSSIEFIIKNSDKSSTLDCMVMGDFFHCPNNAPVKNGQIIITPVRLGVKGTSAIYELPLSLKYTSPAHDMSKMK